MEENQEKKKRDYTAIKRGALVVFILAFILFNASKLFNYIGTKHTVDTGPDAEGQNIPKTKYDSLVKDVQSKLDVVKHQNDSLQKIIGIKDTDLKKVSDSLSKFVKKLPPGPNNAQQKKTESTGKK